MTKDSATSQLPYSLPQSPQSQAWALAEVLGIHPSVVKDARPDDIEAMAATILYRHLDRSQQMEVMELIHSLRNPVLVDQLIRQVVDVKVQPRWGIWSLTNEELLADKQYHKVIDDWIGYIGAAPSAIGLRDLIREAWRRKRIGASSGKLIAVTLVLWGVAYGNKKELNRTNEEIRRRSKLKSSPLHE